jgi:hypothetical protein
MVIDDRDRVLPTAFHVRERMAPQAGIVASQM